MDANDGNEGAASAENNLAWMRRIFSDSIYIWACGQKAADGDEDLTSPDRLIGWLVLFMQGFAYTMLIVLERTTSSSNTSSSEDDSNESGYLLPSVTGAMYLLIASTTHDLSAGFSLVVNGKCRGHRAFGVGLLVVYGIMMSAAMTVLVSTSSDSTSVVLNAVTVLFIADLDEKTLKFFLTVPQKWRLFWAIESIAISFALALIAIIYVGDSSPLLAGNYDIIGSFPTWFSWMANPIALTLCSVLLSAALQAVCDFCDQVSELAHEETVESMFARGFGGVSAALQQAIIRLKGEPCFHTGVGMWIAHGVVSWINLDGLSGFPLAFDLASGSSGSTYDSIVLSNNTLAFVCGNAVLAIGLAAKALQVFLLKQDPVSPVSEPRYTPEGMEPREGWGSCAYSRVPSLLIGWGFGYWASSLLYLLGCSWNGGWWHNAPLAVTLLAYVVVPSFFVCGFFMLFDADVLGTRFETYVRPAVERIRSRRKVEYWIMATVFRDILVLWTWFCYLLRSAMICAAQILP